MKKITIRVPEDRLVLDDGFQLTYEDLEALVELKEGQHVRVTKGSLADYLIENDYIRDYMRHHVIKDTEKFDKFYREVMDAWYPE